MWEIEKLIVAVTCRSRPQSCTGNEMRTTSSYGHWLPVSPPGGPPIIMNNQTLVPLEMTLLS